MQKINFKKHGLASKVLILSRWQDKFTSTQALA